jgi:adenylate cyclase
MNMSDPAADSDLMTTVLKHLDSGVAIVEEETWRIRLENAKFFDWFPPGVEGDNLLTGRIGDIDIDKAEKRLERGRPFRTDVTVKQGARSTGISINLRRLEMEGEEILLVECFDISKQREAEFMLDSYSKMSEKHARNLQKEKDRVEKLLLNVMPQSVYQEFKDYGTTTPQRFDSATILLLDFVGFTELAIAGDPGAVVAELNDIFSAFDSIVELFECERIKTIGDAYLAVSGLPEASAEHTQNVARVALRMLRYLRRRNESHPHQWEARIGIANGPVVGSIVGIHKYVYDIFGPGVNLAARLEGLCETMQILVNEEAAQALKEEFILTELDTVDIKGFGSQSVYSLDGERSR